MYLHEREIANKRVSMVPPWRSWNGARPFCSYESGYEKYLDGVVPNIALKAAIKLEADS